MVPGVTGRLISHETLDDALLTLGVGESRPIEWRQTHAGLGPASPLRTMVEEGLEPLLTILRLSPAANLEATSNAAMMIVRGEGTPPLLALVSGWGQRLDGQWAIAMRTAAAIGARFAIGFNGTHLRLMCAARHHSRRFVEIDLDTAADNHRAAAALSLLFGAESFRPAEGGRSRLDSLIARSDAQGLVVSRSLRAGVLTAAGAVLNALLARRHRGDVEAAFDQALTIVYRLLFLLFAEARMLVPLWHPLYRASYSVESLRHDALARNATGVWDAIRAISRLAHAGCRAGDLTVTAFNGRLFAPSRVPLIERRNLDDAAAQQAIVALSTRPAPDGDGAVPLLYRDLGVEELGAVYEGLLDYQPKPVTDSSASRSLRVALVRSGVRRKASGSYYSPQPIADYLIRRALEPLVRDRTPDQILALRVLDPSMGSGAFLVGACRFLATAYERAVVRDGGCLASDLGPADRAAFRRRVAERCLFGVDANPMAVQLARLSLWLATLAADRPLTFLDHHLVTGDSVMGAWLSSLFQAPRPGRKRRDDLPLFPAGDVEDGLRVALPIRFALERDPNDTAAQVRAKERALARLDDSSSPLAPWKRLANLWCAQWFVGRPLPAALFMDLAAAITDRDAALPPRSAATFLRDADDIARQRRFFHWELEFPEVFFDASGRRRPDAGFDAVLGNPPWEMVRADRGDDGDSSSRAAVRFTRESGAYVAQSDGHANLYQLFVERALALTRPGGSLAMVLPAGLATDHGSAALRRHLFDRSAVQSMVGFENKRGIFPIHRGVRFLLLSARAGAPTASFRCRFGEIDAAALDSEEADEPSRFLPITISRRLLTSLSGSDEAIPDVRTPLDLTLAERASALFAPLASSASWEARFGRELNASDDRRYFRDGGRGVPVIGGRHLEPFRVRAADADQRILTRHATRLLQQRYLRRRLAYRDVSGAGNRTTLIAAVLPARVVSTHTVFCLRTPLSAASQDYLCGLFNSFLINFFVRLRVTSHVTTAIVERLPIPSRTEAGPWFSEIARIARHLSRRDDGLALARLNAIVARLYQLSAAEYSHVLGSFPLVPASERQSALRVFETAW